LGTIKYHRANLTKELLDTESDDGDNISRYYLDEIVNRARKLHSELHEKIKLQQIIAHNIRFSSKVKKHANK
jgi:hypothetical protein